MLPEGSIITTSSVVGKQSLPRIALGGAESSRRSFAATGHGPKARHIRVIPSGQVRSIPKGAGLLGSSEVVSQREEWQHSPLFAWTCGTPGSMIAKAALFLASGTAVTSQE